MDLTEYQKNCARMGAYCERAYRQEDIEGDICPRVSACDVQTLEGYELELMKAYNNGFAELADIHKELINLKTNPNRAELINMYRQDFTVYDSIQALIDDIKAGKVYCPEKAQKQLIGSLERLYQMFLSISQMCFAEFDKMKPQRGNSKLTDEERAKKINEWRERICKMPEYQEAAKKGWVNDFRWTRKGDSPYLFQWLIDTGIATMKQHSVRWNIIDGVFENVNGDPITINSLKSSRSQEG